MYRSKQMAVMCRLISLLALSTIAFLLWERQYSVPTYARNSCITWLTKWEPLSDMIWDGAPNLPKCSNRAIAVSLASAWVHLYNSIHLENVSMMTRIYPYSLDVRNGSMNSIFKRTMGSYTEAVDVWPAKLLCTFSILTYASSGKIKPLVNED